MPPVPARIQAFTWRPLVCSPCPVACEWEAIDWRLDARLQCYVYYYMAVCHYSKENGTGQDVTSAAHLNAQLMSMPMSMPNEGVLGLLLRQQQHLPPRLPHGRDASCQMAAATSGRPHRVTTFAGTDGRARVQWKPEQVVGLVRIWPSRPG